MNNIYLDVDFNSHIDSETNIIVCDVAISLSDINTDEKKEIGYAKLYIINVFKYPDWSTVIDHTDGITGSLYVTTEGLTEVMESEEDFFGVLAVIDRVKISKEYRGLGYGRQCMEEILNYFDIIEVSYVALTPAAFEEEDEDRQKEMTQGLIKFYKSLKFNVVNNESETIIMGRNLNKI